MVFLCGCDRTGQRVHTTSHADTHVNLFQGVQLYPRHLVLRNWKRSENKFSFIIRCVCYCEITWEPTICASRFWGSAITTENVFCVNCLNWRGVLATVSRNESFPEKNKRNCIDLSLLFSWLSIFFFSCKEVDMGRMNNGRKCGECWRRHGTKYTRIYSHINDRSMK